MPGANGHSPKPDDFSRHITDALERIRHGGAFQQGAAPRTQPAVQAPDPFSARLAAAMRNGSRSSDCACTDPADDASATQAATPADAAATPVTVAPRAAAVGAGEHVVRPGECISSIAKQTGHFWDTVWSVPENAELREVRGDPNVLLPGDRVSVPPIRRKREPAESEMHHCFRRRGEPVRLRLRLTRNGEQPLAGEPFQVHFGDQQRDGVTDTEGRIDVPIPGDAMRAVLRIDGREYPLKIGHLAPADSYSGVRGRLNNLGFAAGGEDDDAALEDALRDFQRARGLPETGTADEATRQRLRESHES